MKGKDVKSGNYELIFQAFANLLTKQAEEQNKRDEIRAKQTNDTLVKLTESVDTLTKSHIESKKDQEYSNNRMDRYEEGQKESNEVLKTVSKTIVLLEERVKNQRGVIQRAIEAVVLIVTAVAIAKLT